MSAPLRKVILIGPAFPLRGGIANFNEALARSLSAQGIETIIYSFSLQYPGFLFPGKTQYDTGAGPSDLDIRTRINSVNPLNWLQVAKEIRAQKPDGIIVRYWLPFMGPCLGTIIKRVKKDRSVKVIAITDNVIPHEKRIGDALFTSYFVKQCDGFVTMSKSVLKDLETFTQSPNKIFLPHPIYDIFGDRVSKASARKHLQLTENGRYVLFFGFIRKYKGLDLLIRAMADPRLRDLQVKLIVAGEYYEDAAPYNQLISELGVQDRIVLRTDYIPSDEVRHYFAAADIVAQPYRSATQSGVTQIAYHFERPMLVTDVGGLPEIVPHGRVGYVTAVDEKAVADALSDFYTQDREAQFSANTIVEKERFQWSSFVSGLKGLFQKLQGTDRA